MAPGKWNTPFSGILRWAMAVAALSPMLALGGGQSTVGTLTGFVMDKTMAVLPGVLVKVVNEDTGVSNSTLTKDVGTYSFLLSPGSNYTVTAELAGFVKTTVRKVAVHMADTQRLDIVMELGSITSSVVVSAERSALLSDPTITLDEAAIMGLPLVGADPLTLITTLPGYRASPLGREYDTVGGLPMSMLGTVRDGLISMDSFSAGGLPNTLVRANELSALRNVPQPNTEAYDRIVDNPFTSVGESPLATFSSDVDTASYSNVRRFLTRSLAPPRDAVRIEELINYFSYDYRAPSGPQPIAANIEVAAAPWNPEHRLVRIGIKARDIRMGEKPSNLVFLIDVSGSMSSPERLPLFKSAMRMLVEKLTENDLVSLVTYAGQTGIALRPTTGDKKAEILKAIDVLQASGSTNGAAGIQLAYEQAVHSFISGGVNRVILATDGDFNVGVTNQGDLLRMIEAKAKTGVFFTALGFGMGNLKDSTLEKLADKGNGNYAYIDNLNEARKVLVEEVGGTLVTVAKDVKIQVEFNPALVKEYRLIGYENRVLATRDFNDDTKDAGDMGAGHNVTALIEVVPQDVKVDSRSPAGSKSPVDAKAKDTSKELLNLKIRYKEPDGNKSALFELPALDRAARFSEASGDFRFASAVASFGMILRSSPHKGKSTMEDVIRVAEGSKGADRSGYREEFIQLARRATQLGVR